MINSATTQNLINETIIGISDQESALQTWPDRAGLGGVMAEPGGEDDGPGLLVVVVDINPNQVSV